MDCFRYLSSAIGLSAEGYREKEIRCKIEMAKRIFQDKKKLFTSKLNLKLKSE